VDVQTAVHGQIQIPLRQNLAVGHHDAEIGCEGAQDAIALVRKARPLVDRQAAGEAGLRDGGRALDLTAADGLRRLADDGDDLVAGLDDGIQTRHGELGRAHENDAQGHHCTPAAVSVRRRS
jgi:hypothetical protein